MADRTRKIAVVEYCAECPHALVVVVDMYRGHRLSTHQCFAKGGPDIENTFDTWNNIHPLCPLPDAAAGG